MLSNHRSLKITWLCFVLSEILLTTQTAVRAQSSREMSAASYFARGSEWQARGEFDRANRGMLRLWLKKTSEAEADFAQCVALKPDMKSSLEQRINQLKAQLQIQKE